MKKKILFISSGLGTGHVIRDLAIAREFRRQATGVEIDWLAAQPADHILSQAGERLLPESANLANTSKIAEGAAHRMKLNIVDLISQAKKGLLQNVRYFKQVVNRTPYELVIGDETYEIAAAMKNNPALKHFRFVMIHDFVGFEATGKNPIEVLRAYYLNWVWSKDHNKKSSHFDLGLFAGQPEDIPDKRFGWFLPNRRSYALSKYRFTGYILPFRPSDYVDPAKMKDRLGYPQKPLVVCSVGGTAIGRELLSLCSAAYPVVRRTIPDLQMVLVCGPRIDPGSLSVAPGIEVKGYVPDVHKLFAAGDLLILQGGGASTIEATALKRPFIVFPLKGHFEQERYVVERLERHQVGIRMMYVDTTPDSLAQNIIRYIGSPVNRLDMPFDGAQKAAGHILHLLDTHPLRRRVPLTPMLHKKDEENLTNC